MSIDYEGLSSEAKAAPAVTVPAMLPPTHDSAIAERARKYIAKMPPANSGQGGHPATLAVARTLVHDFGLSTEDARPLLIEYNARCQPSWSENELSHKLSEAVKLSQAGQCKHQRGYLATASREQTAHPTAAHSVSAGEKSGQQEPDDKSQGRTKSTWLSIADLRAACDEEVPWIWRGYLAKEAVTLLASEAKAGKSTLVFGLLEQLIAGQHFLGRETTNGGAVYLSEEPLQTLREKADHFNLANNAKIRFLSRRMTAISLRDALIEAGILAGELGAVLIVVDTLGAWGGLKGDEENNAGNCEAVMSLFKDAATNFKVAVLVVHHTRKDGDVARGSTALLGAADINLILCRENDNRRCLKAMSRYLETPETLRFDLTDAGYVAVDINTGAEARYADILKLIPASPPGMTREEIEKAGNFKTWRVRRAVDESRAEGLICHTGTGKHGDPYRFHRNLVSVPAPQGVTGSQGSISPCPQTVKPCGGDSQGSDATPKNATTEGNVK